MLKKSFWNFESSSKIDVLVEGTHTLQILRALADPETSVQRDSKNTYIFYGETEALLVKPQSLYLKMSIELVYSFRQLLYQ